jgi:hypothetical protein
MEVNIDLASSCDRARTLERIEAALAAVQTLLLAGSLFYSPESGI